VINWLRQLNLRQLCGVVLLMISTLLWLVLPVIPFLPLDTGIKVGAGTGVFLVAEATGYPGLALLGKETVQAVRSGWNRFKSALFGRKDTGGE
jgi:hypothetical protein